MLDALITALPDGGADVVLPRGDHCQIRQLYQSDIPYLRDMFAHCCDADAYLRCFAAIRNFPETMAERLAHIDPTQEIALVATPPEGENNAILGVAHVILERAADTTAEFDVMVRTDQKGHGIGYALMSALLTEARARGCRAVVGYVLLENRPMLQMTAELGFRMVSLASGVAEVRVELEPIG
jgi:acetyltransferase